MRKYGKRDGNHQQIVSELRDAGFGVRDTADLGDGFGDIIVGTRGRNWLFEIKDPSRPLSARKLTDEELKFHVSWPGQINIIETAEQAIKIITGANHG